jgi:PTS system nitrogen regulatory IIA component
MDIADFLTADRVVLDLRVRDKLQLVQELARRTGPTGLTPETVAAALLAREQLGSSGLGKGFALPHARIDGMTETYGLFTRLARPIDFDAIDEQPVDLVFLLLMPAQERTGNGNTSVSAMASVARRFRDGETATQLRSCTSSAAAFALLTAM